MQRQPPCVWREGTGEHLHKRRLATAVVTNDGGQFSRANCQVDVAASLDSAKVFGEPVSSENHVAASSQSLQRDLRFCRNSSTTTANKRAVPCTTSCHSLDTLSS